MDRIDVSEFRHLLQSLENSDTLIRVRLSGESWMNFSRIVLLSERAMILDDQVNINVIVKLMDVVAFELNEPCGSVRAGVVYAVGFRDE